MYESFFGLVRRPFVASADADCYYPATAIETARQTLFRCIDRGEGAALLIGPAGAGKSLLLQVLAEQFRGRFGIALLGSGRFNTRRELLQAILYELGLPYRDFEEGELRLALIDHLSKSDNEQEGMLLLIDEAHLLPLKLVEEVRLITNLVRGGQPKVRLVLAGSPALDERFTSPKLDAFNQRISARCYLQAFDRNETSEYVKAQIEWAGGQSSAIFSPEALDGAYQATQGVPRLLNQVCDHALLLACAAGATSLDRASVEEAWADLQQLPTPWNRDSSHAQSDASPGGEVIEFGILEDEPDAAVVSANKPASKPASKPANKPADEPAADFADFAIDEANEWTDDDGQIELDLSEGEPIELTATDREANGDHAMQYEVQAMPFRQTAQRVDFGRQDPLRRLAEVEQQIAAIDQDCRIEPGAITPWPDAALSFGAFDPFNESFAQEELVIDPFAMTAADALTNRPLVECEEGRKLGRLLRPLPECAAPKLTLAAPVDIDEAAESEDMAVSDDVAFGEDVAFEDSAGFHNGAEVEEVVEDSDPCCLDAVFRFEVPVESDIAAPTIVWRPADNRSRPNTIELPIPQREQQEAPPREPVARSSSRNRPESSDDPELIVIEDDAPRLHQVTVVRRGQYRQLFSNLRRG